MKEKFSVGDCVQFEGRQFTVKRITASYCLIQECKEPYAFYCVYESDLKLIPPEHNFQLYDFVLYKWSPGCFSIVDVGEVEGNTVYNLAGQKGEKFIAVRGNELRPFNGFHLKAGSKFRSALDDEIYEVVEVQAPGVYSSVIEDSFGITTYRTIYEFDVKEEVFTPVVEIGEEIYFKGKVIKVNPDLSVVVSNGGRTFRISSEEILNVNQVKYQLLTNSAN